MKKLSNKSLVSGSIEIVGCSKALTSGTKSNLLSLSSSCNFKEIFLTGPLAIRFIKCVVKPAILFLIRLEGVMAISTMCRDDFLMVLVRTPILKLDYYFDQEVSRSLS